MKYVKVSFQNGYTGCDEVDIWEYDDDVTEEEITQDCEEYLYEYAEGYAHCAFGWDYDYTEDEYDIYLENCTVNWHIMTDEEIAKERRMPKWDDYS